MIRAVTIGLPVRYSLRHLDLASLMPLSEITRLAQAPLLAVCVKPGRGGKC
jgi:hypothetical protein